MVHNFPTGIGVFSRHPFGAQPNARCPLADAIAGRRGHIQLDRSSSSHITSDDEIVADNVGKVEYRKVEKTIDVTCIIDSQSTRSTVDRQP